MNPKDRIKELFAAQCFLAIKGTGPASIKRILDFYPNFSSAWQDLKNVLQLLPKQSTKRFLMDVPLAKVKAQSESKARICVNKILKSNVYFVLLSEPSYPLSLKEIATPPPVLYYQGNLSVTQKPCLAIVGTRNPTPYGISMAKELATDLSRQGFCIVSGLALGIDAISHQAVLEVKGSTIAVVGCGVDVIYPYQNSLLREKILHHGLIISEYLPGTPPESHRFPQRNRIISGLSLGVIVVEAGVKSGALITAKFALEQNREVFTVPGTAKMKTFAGCNALIKQGACLIQGVEDVLDELSWTRKNPIKINQKQEKQNQSHLTLEDKICALLKQMDKLHLEELKAKINVDINLLSSTLLQMEVQGIITRLPGMFYQLTN